MASRRLRLGIVGNVRMQTTAIDTDRWYHVSYGRANGNRWFLYLDGILVGVFTNSQQWAGMSLTIASAGAARDNSNRDKFRGTLDEFRWWNGVSIRDGINNFMPSTAPWADY